jgi:hypothetical protein
MIALGFVKVSPLQCHGEFDRGSCRRPSDLLKSAKNCGKRQLNFRRLRRLVLRPALTSAEILSSPIIRIVGETA